MAVPLGDLTRIAIDAGGLAAGGQHAGVSAEPHGPAEIVLRVSPFQRIAAHPLGQEPDHRVFAWAEFGGARFRNSRQIACRLDHGHLHAEADAEIRTPALPGEAPGLAPTFRSPLAEAAGNPDTPPATPRVRE